MTEREEWRLSSIDGVLVSSLGRILTIPSIKPMPGNGYRHYGTTARYGAFSDGRMIFVHKGKTYKVHRLVCEAFNGPPPFQNAVCMHLDEDFENNRPSNLKWGTQKENLNAPGFIEYCKRRVGEDSPTVKGRKKELAA